MIVGCYSLDLYCDGNGGGHVYNEFPHFFVGKSASSCYRQARRAGWRLSIRSGVAICPKCTVPTRRRKT